MTVIGPGFNMLGGIRPGWVHCNWFEEGKFKQGQFPAEAPVPAPLKS